MTKKNFKLINVVKSNKIVFPFLMLLKQPNDLTFIIIEIGKKYKIIIIIIHIL